MSGKGAGIVAWFLAIVVWSIAGAAAADGEPAREDGMVAVKSANTAPETLDRVEAALTDRGLTIFARIDHSAAAKEAGLELPPTVVVIFGNPKTGTPAMTAKPLSAIDFPLKGLVYQDADGDVWFAYNSADYVFGTIFPRHGLSAPGEAADKYRALLEAVSQEATQ